MLDALQFALVQIENLVNSLNKKTLKQSLSEISQLVNQHGFEAERHLYRCLFSSIDFSGAPHDARGSVKDYHQTQLLIQEMHSLFAKPNFVTLICYALDHPFASQKSLRPGSGLLPQVSRTLKLSRVQEVTLGLALLSSLRLETREGAQAWLRAKLPDLLATYVDADAGAGGHDGVGGVGGGGAGGGVAGLQDMSIEMVHLILTKLREEPHRFGASKDLIEAFLRVLRKDFPKQRVPVVLAPLLYAETEDLPVSKAFREPTSLQQMVVSSNSALQSSQQVDSSLAELLEELGYGCTATPEEMRLTLAEFGVRDITPAAVARCISMFMRTCEGHVGNQIALHGPGSASSISWKLDQQQQQPDTWNVENFLMAVRELNSSLQLRSVASELDHPGFEVKSKRAFELLRKCLSNGAQASSSDLPIDVFYRDWNYAQGQLSFLRHCIIHSDVLCLTFYRYRQTDIGRLKLPPDYELRGSPTQVWRNLDLIDALMKLSEQGFYTEVRELFDYPLKSCPDLLMLSLLQAHESMGILKQELLHCLICILLTSHSSASLLLNYAWNFAQVRPILLHALVDWVSEGEAVAGEGYRASRALDLVLEMLPNGPAMDTLAWVLKSHNHLFSLSLACLAAKRDYVKLEAWITERLAEYGDQFAQAALKFLAGRAGRMVGKDDPTDQMRAAQVDAVSVKTILQCLDRRQDRLTLASEIKTELDLMKISFNKYVTLATGRDPQQQQQPPVLPPQPPPQQQQQPPFAKATTAAAAAAMIGAPVPTISSQLAGLPMSPASAMLKQTLASQLPGFVPQQQQPGLATPKHKIPMSAIPIGSPAGLALPPPQVSQQPPQPPMPMSMHHHPHQQQPMPSMPPAGRFGPSLPPELTAPSPPELDERINMMMKSLFSGTITSDEVFNMLREPKEKPLCNYFLRVLVDEFHHIPTSFPPKQRAIMAELFGQVIALGFQLTSHSVLAFFLRLLSLIVTRNIETEAEQTFFNFGVDILLRCKSSLVNYRQVAAHLLASNNFAKFPKDLQIGIQLAARSQQSGDPDSQIRRAGEGEINEEAAVPPEGVQDAVFFIFNNLSKINMSTKSEELRRAVPDEFMPWLGQYLVMKRVTTEPNFHQLFVDLMDALNVPRLREIVLQQTFRSIRALLQNMRPDLNDYNDRSLLKNIGHFLGLLTLAKNRPILFDDMDLKGLLLEAYCKGQVEMHYAVPFVARTLEACSLSPVFRPPSPWTMGIVRVLKELHMDKAVKNSLKFEVEILCKKLEINFDQLDPAYYLRDSDRIRQIEVENCLIRGSAAGARGSAAAPSTAAEHEQQLPPRMTAPAEEFEPQQPLPPPSQQQLPPQMHLDPSALQLMQQQGGMNPPLPRFKWTDIETSRPLSAFFNVNLGLPLLQASPGLASGIRQTLELTVGELMEPVAQRCVRIVLGTVEGVVRKDFALDDDESHLRSAAHNMTRCLTAGMALITCREALSVNMETKLKQQFMQGLSSPTAHQRELIEDAARVIAQDNFELGTAYIQKVCVEKALVQVDVTLETEYRLRIHARQEGRRYFDQQQLSYQNEFMPPLLRKAVGPPPLNSLAVYSEYANCVPGFASDAPPAVPPPMPAMAAAQPSQPPQQPPPQASQVAAPAQPQHRNEVAQLFDTIVAEVERQSQYIANSSSLATPTSTAAAGAGIGDSAQLVQRLRVLVERAKRAKSSANDAYASKVVEAAVQSLFQTFRRHPMQAQFPQEVLERYKEAHTVVLRLMYQPKLSGLGYSSCMSHVVTQIWTDMPEPQKWNSDAFIELLKIHIVSLQAVDSHLAKQIRQSNLRALRFVMDLFHALVLNDSREQTVLNECDLTGTIAVIAHLIEKSPPDHVPREYVQVYHQVRGLLDFGLLEAHQQPATTYLYSGCSQAREFDDPHWLQEASENLMKKWYTMYSTQRVVDQRGFNTFVKDMTTFGILKTDDIITRFFRLTTDYVMEHCFRALLKSGQEVLGNRVSCYQELDAYIRLIAVMVKHSGEHGAAADIERQREREGSASTKINLLNKILGIISGTLLQEQDIRSDRFHPMPFQRIFILLFSELLSPATADADSPQINTLTTLTVPMLAAFANALHIVRPAKAPSFTYSWVECISHRSVLSKYLGNQAAWSMYAQLLVDLLKFIAPFLATANFIKTVHLLYRGTLRLILVLLHDFPDFISEYHHALCDVIPANCIQLRNLVLSAFPKFVQLLDPIQSPASQCCALPEMQQEPRGSFAGLETNIPAKLREEVDGFLATRKPVQFLTDVQSRIRADDGEEGRRYHVELTNALVLYVGRRAVKRINESGNSLQPYNMTHCVETETLQALVMLCCTEGRYLLLNAMANQLRYPNSHTFYFNQILLFFFRESNNEQIKEQITRVLLERLIVNRPHPWGLLLTFTELLKNPSYKFWDHEFVRCSPSIEKLLESVARSCVPGFRLPPPTPLPLTASASVAAAAAVTSSAAGGVPTSATGAASMANGPPPVSAINSQ
ncbi:hypothetical protein BOX15_Mlig027984g1 [Macrostomum lignano]|uniref:CCR4-NOT transcription complex subunit 1 n=2 Tax=Macrostomum lignano TaxID=282301 RepID=A0A267ECE3_9PLAT|nr:hypothetical protein BOX15_Mlig027984g1 [Macrostomum lignano]